MYIDEIKSPLKPNLHLGTIGLDKTTISHLLSQTDMYPEPVIDYLFPNSIWKTLNAKYSGHSTVSALGNKKVKITSTYFELTIGNQGNRPFSNITIHIGTKDNPNLLNMSVDSLKDYLTKVRAELIQWYNLDFVFDLNTMRVYNAEINVTVPIKYKFDSYRRIIDLMSSLHIEKAVHEKNNKIETYYMNGRKSEQLTLYSKSKEIEDMGTGFDSEVDLLRYELSFKEQKIAYSIANTFRNNIKFENCEDDEKRKLYLKDLTQNSLENLFFEENKNLFEAMDKTLKDDTISEVKLSPFLNVIINRSLLNTLRSDSRTFIESILLYYRNLEIQKYHRPLLLDLKNLQTIIKESYLDQNIKQLLNDALQSVIEHPEQYDDLCKNFVNQSERYEELRDKLCTKHLYPMHEVKEKGKTHIIYWMNPNHTEPDHSSPGSVYYYLYEGLNDPTPAPNAHVMITQNKPQIIYARLEYQPDCYYIAFFEDARIKECQDKANSYNPFSQQYATQFNPNSINTKNTYKPVDLPFNQS